MHEGNSSRWWQGIDGKPSRRMPLFMSLLLGLIIGILFALTDLPPPLRIERSFEVPVDRVVERLIEVPVDTVVEKRIEVPVDRYVEKRIEVPVWNVKYVDRIITERPTSTLLHETDSVPATKLIWRKLRTGMTPASVRELLGIPKSIRGESFVSQWDYDDSTYVTFVDGKLYTWSGPSR